jgi:hypothetical protein
MHIQSDHPMIGLALYHHAHDIWALPRMLLKIREDYHIYLRHYTDLAYETITYAVPINEIGAALDNGLPPEK